MKIAIGFSTKDRTEQVKKVLINLLKPDTYDLFWFDGSTTEAGQRLPLDYAAKDKGVFAIQGNVTGGPDRAFVHAMTAMLAHKNSYDFIGYCEDDVLLPADWFERTFKLFESGAADGLPVGVVSARAYQDRVLLQHPDYAVMHNLGWGHLILNRPAAIATLSHYRTGWTTENRKVFAQLCGRDIAKQWGWKANGQWICSDWGNDAVLAQNGWASLALTPSPVEMLGQDPPLAQQGLHLVKTKADMFRDDRAFDLYVKNLQAVREGMLRVEGRPLHFRLDEGGVIYFTHQLNALNAQFTGPWEHEWEMGFGPFAARAGGEGCKLSVKVAGLCEVMIGGKEGGEARVSDSQSGFEVTPRIEPATVGKQLFINCVIPGSVNYRYIHIDKIKPKTCIYGLKTRDIQPFDPVWRFDATSLLPVAAQIQQAKALVSA